MAHFEALLERALVRVICLFHQTKLPYLALLHHLDEKTTGPKTFSGPIGKHIGVDVHSLEVAISPTIPISPTISPTSSSPHTRGLAGAQQRQKLL